MDNEELISVFNPANAGKLTDEQKAKMASLTTDEINLLAKTYPNQARGKNYLALEDKTKKSNAQLWPLSTWQNLAELQRIGQKQFVPVFVADLQHRKERVPTAKVQDITRDEAKQELAGVQTATEQTVNPTEQPTEPPTDQQPETTDENTPLEKLNKEGLQQQYKDLFGSDADSKLTRTQLIEAIVAKQNEGK